MRGRDNPQGQIRLCWLLLAVAAVSLSLNSPGRGTNLIGLVAFVPFLVALEWRLGAAGRAALRGADSSWRRFWFALFACYLLAVICVGVGMSWLAASAHLFGHLPKTAAVLVTSMLYGLEMGLLFFLAFALPLLVLQRVNGWDIGPRLLWALLVDDWYPRLVDWSLGGATFYKVPLIEQAADVVGAWGLGFFSLGANFLVAFLVSRWLFGVERSGSASFIVNKGMGGGGLARVGIPRVFVVKAQLYGVLLAAALAYGVYSEFKFSQEPAAAADTEVQHLRLVSVQPNFSIFRLSQDENAFPGEPFDMESLLSLSRRGLTVVREPGGFDADEPTLVVWPESAFPWPLLNSDANLAKLSAFARENRTALMLAVSEREQQASGESLPKGLTLLIDANGELTGRYDKITLMPFGEYIPVFGNLPWLGDQIREAFPSISEFAAGDEPTVFNLGANDKGGAGGVRVGGAICFDAVNESVYRGMAAGGAQLIANLTNLAWFGDSNAGAQLEMELRWRAIENRVSVLFSTLTGETKLMDATGKQQGKTIKRFREGVLAERVALRTYQSFYATYQHWLRGAAIIIFVLLVGVGGVYGRLFAATIGR